MGKTVLNFTWIKKKKEINKEDWLKGGTNWKRAKNVPVISASPTWTWQPLGHLPQETCHHLLPSAGEIKNKVLAQVQLFFWLLHICTNRFACRSAHKYYLHFIIVTYCYYISHVSRPLLIIMQPLTGSSQQCVSGVIRGMLQLPIASTIQHTSGIILPKWPFEGRKLYKWHRRQVKRYGTQTRLTIYRLWEYQCVEHC